MTSMPWLQHQMVKKLWKFNFTADDSELDFSVLSSSVGTNAVHKPTMQHVNIVGRTLLSFNGSVMAKLRI